MAGAAFELLDSILNQCSPELEEDVVFTMILALFRDFKAADYPDSRSDVMTLIRKYEAAGLRADFLVPSLLVLVDTELREGTLDLRGDYSVVNLEARLAEATTKNDDDEISMLVRELSRRRPELERRKRLYAEWRSIAADIVDVGLSRMWNNLIAKDKFDGLQAWKEKRRRELSGDAE